MPTDFNRDWTPFAMDAEVWAFGTARICEAHNQTRKRIEELERKGERLRLLLNDRAIARLDELERKLQAQEDYTEMLMRFMAAREIEDTDCYPGAESMSSWWQVFCHAYPSDAAALEAWLEERHAD